MKLLALLVPLALLAGCSSPATTPTPTPAPEPEKTFSDRFNIVPPGSHEVNFEMVEGASVHVGFHASYEVAWDLHSHDGRNVTNWREGRGLDATIDFTAPAGDKYSVWIRPTGPITASVSYNMTGQFTIVQ